MHEFYHESASYGSHDSILFAIINLGHNAHALTQFIFQQEMTHLENLQVNVEQPVDFAKLQRSFPNIKTAINIYKYPKYP